MALKLFDRPISAYSRKVKIALCEKGIPFDCVPMDSDESRDDAAYQDFVLTSPRREVPALVHEDVRLFDSTLILEYLDERWPKPQLSPDTPKERARVRMLEEMMDTEYEAVNWGVMEVRLFRRIDDALARTLLTRAALQFQRLWNRLERELEGRPWMNGGYFGRGDAAAYPQVATTELLGNPVSDRHPRLRAWLGRCAERDSVMQDSAEVAAAFARAPSGPEAGRPRRVRDHHVEWLMKTGGEALLREGLEQGSLRFSAEFE